MRLGTIVRVWKRIDLIEGMEEFKGYEVSNLGEVRSLYYKKTYESKILRPGVDTYGYLFVVLYSNGKKKHFRINRLVALAFIPNDNPDIKTIVNHKDENKQNNNVSNLEWCTNEYNCNYGTRIERIARANNKKVFCPELNKVFNSIKEASEELGLYQSSISKCCKGKKYKTTGGYHWYYINTFLL